MAKLFGPNTTKSRNPFTHGLTHTITPRQHNFTATPEQITLIREDCVTELEHAQAVLTAIVASQFPTTEFLQSYVPVGSATVDTEKSLVAFVATARGSQQLYGMTSSIGALYQRTIDNFLNAMKQGDPSAVEQQVVVAIHALQALSNAKATLHKLAERLTHFHNSQQFVRHLDDLVENAINQPLQSLRIAISAFLERNDSPAVRTEYEHLGHLLRSIDRELTGKLGEREPATTTLTMSAGA